MLFNVLILIFVILLFIVAFVLVRTITFARPFEPVELAEETPIESQVVAEHLADAIRCQTITVSEKAEPTRKAFLELQRVLEQNYPRLHASLKREMIGDYSMLYTWEGSEPELDPALFAGHLDVVPADPASLDEWHYPPFKGQIAEGYVWGRGTQDIKCQVVTLMESVEYLLKNGYHPQRTILLAFGHDEEIGGYRGARQIATSLQERGTHLAAVIDEGASITNGIIPGAKLPVAMVGIGEKGLLNLDLTVDAPTGHSSTPPPQTAIGILAEAIVNIEENPLPVKLGYARNLFKGIGPAAPFFMQLAFANLWLSGGIVRRVMAGKPQSNALIRSTTAVTVISGGIKENILPSQAKARINFRLIPETSIAAVCEHVRRVIGDKRVTFKPMEWAAWEASPLSPTDGAGFKTLQRTIRQIFGNIPVAPYLVLGATDSRHYVPICQQIFRFTPNIMTAEDLKGIHGINEHISIEVLGRMVQFYIRLLQAWGTEPLE
jgi:carboxypeptidase PM20D1